MYTPKIYVYLLTKIWNERHIHKESRSEVILNKSCVTADGPGGRE